MKRTIFRVKLFKLLGLVALIYEIGSWDGGYTVEERSREPRQRVEEPRVDASINRADKKLQSSLSIPQEKESPHSMNPRIPTSIVIVPASSGSEDTGKAAGSLFKRRDEDVSSLFILMEDYNKEIS